MKKEWKIESWSFPDAGMVHIVITDGQKRVAKNYSQKGSFFKFMLNCGLYGEAFEIAQKVW